MKTSMIGSPLMFSKREQTKTPTTESSHTGTSTKSILSKLYKDLTSSLLISTPVGPMKNENVPDVKKPDQLFSLRGTVTQPVQQAPSNIMAGAPSPKPLSGAPRPPGGNVQPPPMSGGPAVGAMGGGAVGGGARPPVQGPPPMGGARPPVAATPGIIPGVPRGSQVECKDGKCKLTTSPSSTIQGIISMTIPVDTSNKPILTGIKDVSFIPGTVAATLGVPITKTPPQNPAAAQPIGPVKVAAAPPQMSAPRPQPVKVIHRRIVRTYVKRGLFGRTETVHVYQDGSKTIYIRNRKGKIIRVIHR